jgi:hypothetical protein
MCYYSPILWIGGDQASPEKPYDTKYGTGARGKPMKPTVIAKYGRQIIEVRLHAPSCPHCTRHFACFSWLDVEPP